MFYVCLGNTYTFFSLWMVGLQFSFFFFFKTSSRLYTHRSVRCPFLLKYVRSCPSQYLRLCLSLFFFNGHMAFHHGSKPEFFLGAFEWIFRMARFAKSYRYMYMYG